jgi:hypothetical protein
VLSANKVDSVVAGQCLVWAKSMSFLGNHYCNES